MKYNCEEYIQLLKSQQALKKQNKSLKTEDPIKYSKLRKYSAKISDYLHWSQKNQYLQLIKDFLNYKIDGKEFDNKFSKMVTVIEKKSSLLSKNYQELKCIEPSSMSLGFGTWISEIYLCCNEFYSDFNEEEDRAEIPFAKTEEQLRDAVKSLFPEIQKYCEE
jgi:hypothetical protein